ncbi:hypothetical protein LINPERHAP1_LOCUS56 [Linum perenne]
MIPLVTWNTTNHLLDYRMASQLHMYAPLPSFSTIHTNPKLSFSKLPWPRNNARRSYSPNPNALKVSAEKRDNLDNLQRVGNQQHSQFKTPAQQASSAAPTGVWERFPTTTRTVQQMIDTMNRFMDDPFGSSLWPPSLLQGDIGGYMGRGRMP